MDIRRGSACVVFDVMLDGADPPGREEGPSGWREGPLPVVLADGATAGAEQRMTYFESRVAESLYGAAGRPARWHRRVPTAEAGLEVEAVELLRLPPVVRAGAERRGLAVLHVRLPDSPLEALPGLAGLASQRDRYTALLPDGVRIAGTARRAWTLCHVTFTDGCPPAVMPPAYEGWSARDQWLWLLSSATPLERFPPDPDDEALFAGRVRFSADWQALVLRDGTAFLGTSPDPGDDTSFHATAARFVHTLYLDTFLLGRLQILGVNSLANALSGLRAHEADARRLLALEGRMIDLRRALWSSHVTVHGKANELLERFQEQHRLPELLTRAGDALADAARYVDTARARRSSVALGLLSAVGLPFGVTYAAGALWGEPGPLTFVVCTLVALVMTTVLFGLVPPMRRLAADELRRSRD
ncbi:hypothetical protein ABZ626_30720 [Streptomyces longispororuber]|uniref:hypothetical protein n=1 Tax=Streptomyces longispororuber TaxID=68230 RepID=UPI0033E7EA38